MRAWLSTGVVLLLSVALTSPVWAQDKNSIALIHLEISGDGPPELREQLQTHISDGFKADGLTVTDLNQTLKILKDVPELIGCSSTACLERIFERIPANRFVRVVVNASGANYEIRLELLSALEDESLINKVEESCAVCTISDLNTLAADAARKLLHPPSDTQKVSVMIATNPPGATIIVDEQEVGVSPLDLELALGSHTVTARLDGHTRSETPIEVKPDSGEQQTFELQLPVASVTETPGPAGADYGSKKWIAVGGSAALLALGAVLISVDGDASCSSNTATCPEFRDTMTGGIVSLSGGVLLGAFAGWMFYKESSTQTSNSSLSVQATKGGGIAGYGFRF